MLPHRGAQRPRRQSPLPRGLASMLRVRLSSKVARLPMVAYRVCLRFASISAKLEHSKCTLRSSGIPSRSPTSQEQNLLFLSMASVASPHVQVALDGGSAAFSDIDADPIQGRSLFVINGTHSFVVRQIVSFVCCRVCRQCCLKSCSIFWKPGCEPKATVV